MPADSAAETFVGLSNVDGLAREPRSIARFAGTSGAFLKSAVPSGFSAFGTKGLLNCLKRKGDVMRQIPGRDHVALAPLGAKDHQPEVTILRPFRGDQAVTVVCFDYRYAACIVIN